MNILERILEDTRQGLAQRATPPRALEERIASTGPTRSLAGALRQDHLAIIAEIKRASPSKGLLREAFCAEDIADQYTAAGADAISVLTENLHFSGSLQDLARVRAHTTLPLLRKDFIVDPYQLLEARAYGADAVLLIAAALSKEQLRDLMQAAEELSLECLVEVHETREMDKLDFDLVTMMGVNNRDLRTFEVDINHSLRAFALAPPDVVRVSESGIRTGAQLAYLSQRGVNAVLIGETFMRASNPGAALRFLRHAAGLLPLHVS